MALVSSAVYESADLMRDQLQANLFNGQDIDVKIGQPSEAAGSASEDLERPVLNLFFYKIQPPGFFPDTGPNETWWARLHCLVTAFGASNDKGGDELKIIGQVLSYFHEHPTLKGTGEKSKKFYWLEVIFQPLTSEEINQIWSTFGDVAYRPSLTYEIALIPVEPKVKAIPAPPVASGGTSSNVTALGVLSPASPPAGHIAPAIGVIEIDLTKPDWAPAVAFIDGDKILPRLTRSWSDVEAGGNSTFAELWIAGESGAAFDLVWQSGVSGSWTDLPVLLIDQKAIPLQTDPINQSTLDPLVPATDIEKFRITKARVKADDLGIEKAGPEQPDAATQFLIRARRTLADGSTARSNPLILNITGSKYIVGDGS